MLLCSDVEEIVIEFQKSEIEWKNSISEDFRCRGLKNVLNHGVCCYPYLKNLEIDSPEIYKERLDKIYEVKMRYYTFMGQ